ncbi:hypothetical protein OHV05_29030 [Kitasatospora sp. NBC_00070]|uniref:hypothetical protein n=1 Tax=Kitasatospora sp. NBC_00070 TaxID=2975962 RepID=UPI003248A770
MIRNDQPFDGRLPTEEEVAAEFEEPIALVRSSPGEWKRLFGRQGADGFLCHVGVTYAEGRELRGVVQTSRPAPPAATSGSFLTPEGELSVFLTNAGILRHGAVDGSAFATTRATVVLDGQPQDVPAVSHGGCTSAEVTRGALTVIVTGPDAYWDVLSDVMLRRRAA